MPSRKQDQDGQDAIQLLKQDHEAVRHMFEDFEQAGEHRKYGLASEICRALTVHTTIEEEIFYPRARAAIDADGLMFEAGIEHDTVKQLIERVMDGQVDETQLAAIMKVMNEYVNHHVNEEHRRMFPAVKRSKIDLYQLGLDLQARKRELEAEHVAATAGDAGEEVDDGQDDGGKSRHSRGGMAAHGPSGDDR